MLHLLFFGLNFVPISVFVVVFALNLLEEGVDVVEDSVTGWLIQLLKQVHVGLVVEVLFVI